MKRRKPKSERKEANLMVRVTEQEKAALVAAAKRKGMGVGTWLRMLGLDAAKPS